MPRLLLPLALIGVLALPAAPAVAGGGAVAPGPDAPRKEAGSGGGAVFDPDARPPAKRERRPSRKPAAKPGPARKKQPAQKVPPTAELPTPRAPSAGHLFPVVGTYSFGGKDSRFGAGRRGHTHQGQDIAAAQGTPVVAPRSGVVEVVRYQASGAGHYVVLDGAGEDRDYVFMHLVTGSIPVSEGQTVRKGALLGRVGNTGVSFGPHLHFEIWVGGGWYTGGHPIDPLPILRRWAR